MRLFGAFFAKFRPNFDDRCRHCGSDAETVDHLLNECPTFAAARQAIQSRKGQTVTVTLYGDSVAQLGAAVRFIAEALRET